MDKFTFDLGNYDRYNPDADYLTRCKDPEGATRAAEDEKALARILGQAGMPHRPARKFENTQKHFDVVGDTPEREQYYEVKGPKAIKTGTPKQDARILVEWRWVFEGVAHFMCFRRLDGKFRVVTRKSLLKLMEQKRSGEWTSP